MASCQNQAFSMMWCPSHDDMLIPCHTDGSTLPMRCACHCVWGMRKMPHSEIALPCWSTHT